MTGAKVILPCLDHVDRKERLCIRDVPNVSAAGVIAMSHYRVPSVQPASRITVEVRRSTDIYGVETRILHTYIEQTFQPSCSDPNPWKVGSNSCTTGRDNHKAAMFER